MRTGEQDRNNKRTLRQDNLPCAGNMHALAQLLPWKPPPLWPHFLNTLATVFTRYRKHR
jgi:hypothetical protein